MGWPSVPEGEGGVKDRNGECAVKMCEILSLPDSGAEPRVELPHIPLLGWTCAAEVVWCTFVICKGQRSVRGISGTRPAAKFFTSWYSPPTLCSLFLLQCAFANKGREPLTL